MVRSQDQTPNRTKAHSNGKITVTWDELKSRKVEARLSEQTAIARNRAYAKLDADAVPESAGPAKKHLIYNSIVYMAAFGILAGLLAFEGWWVMQRNSTGEREAGDLIRQMQEVSDGRDAGRYTDSEAEQALGALRDAGQRIHIS